jgi:ABC-type amino acid transport system permease subunit
MSANHRPPSDAPRFVKSRPLRLIIGAVVGVVLLALLVSPVLIGGGTPSPRACARTLRYASHLYVARAMPTPRLVQSLAIGIGVLSGCGTPPSNINVRSFSGVGRSAAIGIPSDTSSVYIRRGVCASVVEHTLWSCLRSR